MPPIWGYEVTALMGPHAGVKRPILLPTMPRQRPPRTGRTRRYFPSDAWFRDLRGTDLTRPGRRERNVIKSGTADSPHSSRHEFLRLGH